MTNFGFIKIATAIPSIKVSDTCYNSSQIVDMAKQAASKGVQVTVFPELSITGYSCGDLFGQQLLLSSTEESLNTILKATTSYPMLIIVGMPIAIDARLYNCAVAMCQGNIVGVVPKSNLPTYKEFYEKRWFTPASQLNKEHITLCGQEAPIGLDLLFECQKAKIAIEICEDLWVTTPPSNRAAIGGANVIVNLSATNELIGKHYYLRTLIQQQSARCMAAYVYASAGFGESSTDIVFTGNGIIAENGEILSSSKRFEFEPQLTIADIDIERIETDRQTNSDFAAAKNSVNFRQVTCPIAQLDNSLIERAIDPHPFVPANNLTLSERCEEIFNIQLSGLAKRLVHTHTQHVVIGISGGLDSTLALLVCVKTFDKLKLDRKGIVGITMPGFGTTDRTYRNAMQLMQELGITIREISIKAACEQHFLDINHDATIHDITYENSQARERTQILMDVANQTNGLVIGTGDLSELALGWATYNGDHMSMYGVNVSIPKTLVRHLVKWVANNESNRAAKETLLDIVDTPISPELIPADEKGNIVQKTEDLVGPYELHDFFLYYTLRWGFRPQKIAFLAEKAFGDNYDRATIKRWITIFFRRFFNQQFKRSCLPDGPKVGSVSLSPRGDWRMPSDASSALWLADCENI